MPNTLEVLINGDGNIVLKNDKRGGPKVLLSSKLSVMFNTSNTKPLLKPLQNKKGKKNLGYPTEKQSLA